jgi:hypothetical protein
VPPPVRYARSGELNIAYQVVGDGPADLLMIPGWFSHLALDWEEPSWVRWCERLASFARVVRFDKRAPGCLTGRRGFRRRTSGWLMRGR